MSDFMSQPIAKAAGRAAEQPAAPKPRRERPSHDKGAEQPFWRQKSLEEMSRREWESLCDGCGRCCLVKLEDEDTGEIHFTDIGCKLFDPAACRCRDYANRVYEVRDCIKLTPEIARSLKWLPPTCAYRVVAEGRDLAWWHPLVSGSAETVHAAGISARGRVAASEREIGLDEYIGHIVAWPSKRPRAARAPVVKAKSRRQSFPELAGTKNDFGEKA
jgi:uncharacterized protein